MLKKFSNTSNEWCERWCLRILMHGEAFHASLKERFNENRNQYEKREGSRKSKIILTKLIHE